MLRFLLWSLFPLTALAETPLLIPLMRDECGTARQEAVLLLQQELTLDTARQICRRLLEAQRGPGLRQVWVATDRDDFRDELTGKPTSENDYAGWQRLYRQTGGKLKPMAQLIRGRNGSVLRVRDHRDQLHREVVEGADPLWFEVAGERIEVLDLRFGGAPGDGRWRPPCLLYVFAKTNTPLTDAQGIAFAKQAQARFGVRRVWVTIDQTGWFIYDNFPAIFRFAPIAVPPSKEQYDRTFQMGCGNTRRGVNEFSCVSWPIVGPDGKLIGGGWLLQTPGSVGPVDREAEMDPWRGK